MPRYNEQQFRESMGLVNAEADRLGASAAVRQALGNIMLAESGGNPAADNPRSSAYGLFQFIDDTWAQVAGEREDVGNSDADRRDPRQQAIAGIHYAMQNEQRLERTLGRDISAGELYLAHFMGPGGALRALRRSDDTPIQAVMSADAIAANRGVELPDGTPISQFTVGDLRRWADMKMGAEVPDAIVYNARHHAGETSQGEDDAERDRRRRQLMGLGVSEDDVNEMTDEELLGAAFISLLMSLFGEIAHTENPEIEREFQREVDALDVADAARAAAPASTISGGDHVGGAELGELPRYAEVVQQDRTLSPTPIVVRV